MNKILALVSVLLSVPGFAQDSTAIKNTIKINELKTRLANIQSATAPGSKECADEIGKLSLKLKTMQDSVHVLRTQLNALLAEKNNDEMNILARIQLEDCKCTRIFFNPDEASMDYEKLAELDSISKLAKAKGKFSIRLVGHADKSGSEPKNITLSKQRVEGIKDFLVGKKGLNAGFVQAEWHGSTMPIKNVQDADKLNRRVEIFLTFP